MNVLEEVLQSLPPLVEKARLESHCHVSEAFLIARIADQKPISKGV
jgi:hypothetical protein